MSDDLTNSGVQDRSRINVNEPHEIRYWTQRFEVSEADLRKAVAEVGVSVKAVADHLGKASMPRPSPALLHLALQGGGAQGAFTWGVLDCLLDRDDIEIGHVSGT